MLENIAWNDNETIKFKSELMWQALFPRLFKVALKEWVPPVWIQTPKCSVFLYQVKVTVTFIRFGVFWPPDIFSQPRLSIKPIYYRPEKEINSTKFRLDA